MQKKIHPLAFRAHFWFCVGTFLSIGLIAPHAYAQADLNIAVLDILRVESKSTAWNINIQKLETDYNRNREAILKKDQELQKKVAEYQQQRPLLSPEQQQQRDQEMNQSIAELQNTAAEQNANIETRQVRSNQALRQQIALIVEKIASEKKLDLIFEVSEENFSVVFYTERLDITPEVISQLNNVYPKIILQ